LANCDFDTGAATRPAEYSLADNTYADLAIKLAGKDVSAIDAPLRDQLLKFFRDPSVPFATKANAAKWKATLAALDKLKASVSQN
jgi:hypothetical protein